MATPVIRVKDVPIVVRKWIQRIRASKDFWVDGIQHPKRNPIEAALSMKETLMRKMADPATWDKWEEKLKGIKLEDWIKATIEKGGPRWVPGCEFGSGKYEMFYSEFKTHLEAGLAEVYKLPRVTLEDAIRRAETMIRHNAKFKFIPKGIPGPSKYIR